jgi:hypothetical protein
LKQAKRAKESESEFVMEKVSEATGVRFELVPPHPAFPLPVEKLDWFMRCRNKDEIAKAPYLNVVWKEKGGPIRMESLAVGDTVDWIEIAYGDEQVEESLDIDYSRMDDPAFQAEFNRKFPIVMGRIRKYQEVAARVSKETGAKLEIRRSGSRGMLVFTVAAEVRVKKGASLRSLGTAVERGVGALKKAYDEIEKPDAA